MNALTPVPWHGWLSLHTQPNRLLVFDAPGIPSEGWSVGVADIPVSMLDIPELAESSKDGDAIAAGIVVHVNAVRGPRRYALRPGTPDDLEAIPQILASYQPRIPRAGHRIVFDGIPGDRLTLLGYECLTYRGGDGNHLTTTLTALYGDADGAPRAWEERARYRRSGEVKRWALRDQPHHLLVEHDPIFKPSGCMRLYAIIAAAKTQLDETANLARRPC
jgi:hypothetical protein